jgi:hypothetical protein
MAIEQVVAAKSNGDLYNTIPPNVNGSGAGGNGGSVAKASNTDLLDGVEISRYDAGVFGSAVIDNLDQDIANKALSAGTFAYNNQRPVAKKTTSAISGVANDFLVSGAARPTLVQSIHKIQVLGEGYAEGVRTRKLTSAIRAGKWNQYTGEFEAGYPQQSTDIFSLDPTYKDVAANPTREVPGSLTYKTGAPEAVNDVYKEKTG